MGIANDKIKGARIEGTHPSIKRGSGRPSEAMTALAGRIRALERSEPHVVGEARSAAIADLNALQLRLERLALQAWRSDYDRTQGLADTFTLAQDVDRLARLWPVDAVANLAVASAHRPRQPERFDPDRKAA